MPQRLLLVEQSAAMRNTATEHLESLGYAVDACESYERAVQALGNQYQKFGGEYTALVFGWPIVSQDDASTLAAQLNDSEHRDLPVLVMSTDMRAETRAWAATRDNTAVLPWRNFNAVQARLDTIIESEGNPSERPSQGSIRGSSQGSSKGSSKGLTQGPTQSSSDKPASPATVADSSDMHVLVVDDSATIRFSLRDLLQVQGYKVTLVATREEALQAAVKSRFDIAVLDYYLIETTGDLLCKELLSDRKYGDLVCMMFTGTYSDHIIKRSLRAGAIECILKNESSELILSRVDAISRIVRQRRQLQKEQIMLENVIEHISGALILIDRDGHIAYVNSLAVQELGIASKEQLLGSPSGTLLAQDEPIVANSDLQKAQWHLPGTPSVEVDYQCMLMPSNGYGLIRFTRRHVPAAAVTKPAQRADADSLSMSLVKQFSLPHSIDSFMDLFLDCLEQAKGAKENHKGGASLLMLDVFIRADEARLVSVSCNEALAQRLYASLQHLIVEEHHVTMMGDNRFGIILRHSEESQAYVMTRKVMQHCISFDEEHGDGISGEPLACTASLLGLTRNANQPANVLLQHAFKGMELVNSREPNQAILLDARRLLSADPVH